MTPGVNGHSELIQAYNEGLYSLAAMGVRMVVEGVCQNKKITGNLATKIDCLVEQRILSHSQGEVLHELRHHGNEAAHELVKPSKHQLKTYLQIIDTTLETIYEYQGLKSSFKAKRNKRRGQDSQQFNLP